MADHSISLQALVTLTSGTFQVTPPVITSTSTKFQKDLVTFASGDNTLTPPAGATLCLLIFNSGGAVYKLKKVGGDTGVTLLKTMALLPVNAAFIINADALDTVVTEVYWF